MKLLRHLLCALGGHKPQYDKPMDYPKHYPYPCRCGEVFTAHRICNCKERWNR